tara:strand:- start:443 stop:652 length:210 start_codon:yes stop_codon:yes gene_type:complete
MYIDKYNIENYGSIWNNGKEKKNRLVGSMSGHDLDIKKLIHILEEYHETMNGEYAHKDIDIKITMKERK